MSSLAAETRTALEILWGVGQVFGVASSRLNQVLLGLKNEDSKCPIWLGSGFLELPVRWKGDSLETQTGSLAPSLTMVLSN